MRTNRSGSAPAAAHENVAPATIFVMVGDPARAQTRGMIPAPAVPIPAAAFPNPTAADPNRSRPWNRRWRLHYQGRRRGIDVNLGDRGRDADLNARSAGLHHASG